MEHRNFRRRTFVVGAAAAATLALPAGTALARTDRVVRLVLPHATGSGVDIITRTIQPALAAALGASIVVDNQAGAGGVIGLQQLARAPADGSVLSVVSNNVVILPSVLRSVPFDMPGDFTPIAILGHLPVLLVVNPKVPATNAQQLIALLRERGESMNYGSGGNGTILHLATAMFLHEARVTAMHIPFRGVGPMVAALMAGQVEFATAALPSVQGHLRSGTLRAIGVTTAQRVAAAPDVATFVEQGLPNYVVEAWFGVLGPKGLPASEVQRVHAALVAAFGDPEVRAAMDRQGNVVNIVGPDQATAFFRSERLKYAELVRRAGVEAQ